MLRYMFMAASLSVSALAFAQFANNNPEVLETAGVVARDQVKTISAKQKAKVDDASSHTMSGTVRIDADRMGHYRGDFRLNNFRVDGLIDTGATTVAINESVARRAGISVRNSDFVYAVTTANGQVKAARAVIPNVSIGSIRISNVEAMVLPDKALDVVLVGMSFMQRLRSFEHERGTLVLRR